MWSNRVTSARRWSTVKLDVDLGPPLAAQDRHRELQRGKLDRRPGVWLDRLRRFHLRKANEPLEDDAARPRPNDLSLFRQRRQDHDCHRDLRIDRALFSAGIKMRSPCSRTPHFETTRSIILQRPCRAQFRESRDRHFRSL
jgi:hypothetical protein